jgi:hypothetical protein
MGGGTVSSLENTRLLSAAEAVESRKKAKSLSYRPPASSSAPAKK